MKVNACFPSFLGTFAPIWYWLTISLGVMVAFVLVFPAIYLNTEESWTKPFQQVLLVFFVAEMVINWTCLKFVSSVYVPQSSTPDGVCGCEQCQELSRFDGVQMDLDQASSKKGRYTMEVPTITHNGSGSDAQRRHVGSMFLVHKPSEGMPETTATGTINGHVEEQTASSPSSSNLQGVVFPYWSWKPCYICQLKRPPRSHHCPICKSCILRRDHHCYFTNTCVGQHNLRYFVVFNVWAAVLTTHSIILCLQYILSDFGRRNSFFDILLPVTVLRGIFGFISFLDLVFILVFYSCIFFWLTTVAFTIGQIKHILIGLTDFEVTNKMKLTCISGMSDNIRAVFGEYWGLNLIFPMHWLFGFKEDGIHWPYIRIAE